MSKIKQLDVTDPEIKFRQVAQWKDGKKYPAKRLEVQNYTSFTEAISLGAGFAIGFWFVSAIPLIVLGVIIASLI